VVDPSSGDGDSAGPLDLAAARARFRSDTEITVVAAGEILVFRASVIAAAASDLVVLVARRGVTKRTDVDEAREVLAAAGARLAAAVLLD
jgi:hypothetical protein